jgi:hypothetical protein
MTLGGHEADLRDLLKTLDPKARDDLRRVLIRDQADRAAVLLGALKWPMTHGPTRRDPREFLDMHDLDPAHGFLPAWRSR